MKKLLGRLHRPVIRPSFFQLTVFQRIMVVLISPLPILFSLAAFVGLLRWKPHEVHCKVLRLVGLEGATALLFVTVAILVYALFKPRWARRLIEYHLIVALGFLTVASISLLVILLTCT